MYKLWIAILLARVAGVVAGLFAVGLRLYYVRRGRPVLGRAQFGGCPKI